MSVVEPASNVIEVVCDSPKMAVPVGTVAGDQLAAVFQTSVPGLSNHVAFWACASVHSAHHANTNSAALVR
jgi:hypothetical protein